MEESFRLTTTEWIFLGGAIVFTIPLVLWIRYVIKELRKG